MLSRRMIRRSTSILFQRSTLTSIQSSNRYRFLFVDKHKPLVSIMPGTRAKRNASTATAAIPTKTNTDVDAIKDEIEVAAAAVVEADPVPSSRKQKAEGQKQDTNEPAQDRQDDGKKSKWEPKNWQTVLENIKKMRSGNDAPVDSMGCERTMEEDVDPKTKRYQTLVSLMLSSQTKDQITYAAMQKLQKEIGLNIPTILTTEESIIADTIKPVSFWRRKATYIKNTTQILRHKFDDDIPDTVEGLCSLPGVGPKMAYICMNVAWNQNAGIGVDTHVHRIANRLQWTGPKEAKTPEKTREGLESWLDPDLWQEINILLVGFGQTICTAVNPKCSDCLNNQLCTFGKAQLRSKGAKKSKANANTKKQSKGKAKAEEDEDSDSTYETSEYF